MFSDRRWAIITLILLLGAAGRILHITQQSFWVDEGYAFYHAHFPDLMTSLARDTHPPLYFAALRLWSEVAGHSELALRWFSVLPSMLSLGLIFQLARELMAQRAGAARGQRHSAPYLAMLMLALADAENFLASEARHYTWLVFLVTSSMFFFLRWIRRSRRSARWSWILATALMAYTHYITVFAGFAQGLYALICLRGAQRRRALAGLVIAALALAPWLLLVGAQQLGNSGANWSVDLSAAVIRDIQVKYFTEQWALVAALMLLGFFTVVYGREGLYRLRWEGASWLLLLWLVFPFSLTLIANEFLPFLQPRRLTLWTPVIALLLALGLSNVRPPIRNLLIIALLVYGLFQVDFYRVKPKWREVADLTARYAVSGDLVLTDIAGGDYQLAYYLQREAPGGKMLPEGARYESLKIQRDFYPETYETWLPQLLDRFDTVWLMYWSNDPSAFNWLRELGFERSADFVHEHDGGASGNIDMHVYRYDRFADDPPLVQFDNGMTLKAAQVVEKPLRVDLLWETAALLKRDFTVSVKLLDENGLIAAQRDSQPQLNLRPTSGWHIDEAIFSPHELELMQRRSDGEYQIIIEVYYFEAGQPVNIPTASGADAFTLATLFLENSGDSA
ncbi:MAG: glycosyltransferase family 39 protein [Chloroflexota bacterium]|nr:glycosyltransferase family 39 protein [Chloroflexota bacterium]